MKNFNFFDHNWENCKKQIFSNNLKLFVIGLSFFIITSCNNSNIGVSIQTFDQTKGGIKIGNQELNSQQETNLKSLFGSLKVDINQNNVSYYFNDLNTENIFDSKNAIKQNVVEEIKDKVEFKQLVDNVDKYDNYSDNPEDQKEKSKKVFVDDVQRLNYFNSVIKLVKYYIKNSYYSSAMQLLDEMLSRIKEEFFKQKNDLYDYISTFYRLLCTSNENHKCQIDDYNFLCIQYSKMQQINISKYLDKDTEKQGFKLFEEVMNDTQVDNQIKLSINNNFSKKQDDEIALNDDCSKFMRLLGYIEQVNYFLSNTNKQKFFNDFFAKFTKYWEINNTKIKINNKNFYLYDLFPFLVSTNTGIKGEYNYKKYQILFRKFSECYKKNGNFIKYLDDVNTFNETITYFNSRLQKSIKKCDESNAENIRISISKTAIDLLQYVCRLKIDDEYKFLLRDFIIDILSQNSIKFSIDNNVLDKNNNDNIDNIEDMTNEDLLETKDNQTLKDTSEFIESAIKNGAFKIKLKNGNTILSQQIAFDMDNFILDQFKFLEIFYKKNNDGYENFDDFLKNETSLFELDNYKDSFSNEPNKKNILLFLIAKRLYDSEEYLKHNDELIKYVIAHASKEMLFATDINGLNALDIAAIKKEEKYVKLILARAKKLGCEKDLENAKINDNFKHYIKSEYIKTYNNLLYLIKLKDPQNNEINERIIKTNVILDRNNVYKNSICGKTYKELQNIDNNASSLVLYNIYPAALFIEGKNKILR